MNRFFIVLVVLATTLLNGCANAPGSGAVVYDFGLPAARLPGDERGPRLALEVRSPAWFDSLKVDYRLAYNDPLRQREYSDSRWAANPGVLLGQSLRQQLGVVNAVAADCVLRVDIQEFSQVFDSPQTSYGVLQADVSLSGPKRQLIAERQVTLRKAAATADAGGGVKAMVTAGAELGQQLSEWLLALGQGSALRSCRLASP